MLDFIEKLQRKPLAYRKRILFLSTTVITGVIFVIWFSTFNLNTSAREVDIAAIEKDLRPIDEIKTNIASFIDSVKKISADIFDGATTSPN
ncbi:MAG: hypothetical protein Q7R65_00270 [bacterium]|nr:hypothetical protein [bacterium]